MFYIIAIFIFAFCRFEILAAAAERTSSGSTSIESFTFVDSHGSSTSDNSFVSFPSVKKSAAGGAGSPIFPVQAASAAPIAKPVDGFVPVQFPLSSNVMRLMEEADLTPEAVLEMLRPTLENPQAFGISAKLYTSDGRPIPEAIRVIEGGEEAKGSSTDALFLVQVNTHFLHRIGMPISSVAGKLGIRFLKELRDAGWQTKLVIKVLKSIGTRRDGLRKVSFESLAREQIRNLERVKASKVARINYFRNPSLPRMTFDEVSYYYVDSYSDKHYFSILHGAKGMPFSAIWDAYQDKRVGADQLQESAYAIGKALGAFHVYTKAPQNISSPNDFSNYAPICHGDFYWQNVFYDFEGKRVYFIDNESMARSFDTPQYIETDFLRFYSHQLFGSYPNAGQCSINKFSHEDIKIAYRAFFQGYIAAYPKALQPMLATYIKQVVGNFNNAVKGAVFPQAAAATSTAETAGQPTEGEKKLQYLFDGIFS